MVSFMKIIIIMLFSLISVAFLTLLERSLLSIVGFRVGPNKVSYGGLLQPMIDAMKISNNSTNILQNYTFVIYYFSSIMMISVSLFMWLVYPFEPKLTDFKLSLMFLLIFMVIHSIMLILSGWCLYNKYSMISTLRSISQMISYEAMLYMVIFFFILFSNSFNMSEMELKVLYFPYLLLFWIMSCLAELGRSPFDYPESESELVSGFNIDFGSKIFSILFMSEYSNLLFFSLITSFMFFKSFIMFFFFFFFFVWIRSVLPRSRYDWYMKNCWKMMVPLLTLMFMLFLLLLI